MAPLDELFADTDALDEELVTRALKPYLVIDPKQLTIRPQARWAKASNKQRIIAFLLARKAMQVRKKIAPGEEVVAPAVIIKETGVPSGSVYPVLKELYESRPQIVDKDNKARYSIPGWAVANACAILEGEEDDE